MFEKELNLIQDVEVKRIAQAGVNIIPEYFYHVPASSSGKYHPSYALGDGGLYRHVQVAVSIATMLFRIYEFSEIDRDLIVASLILHDGWKQGLDGSGGRTLHEHPLIACEELKKNIIPENTTQELILRFVCENIESHMGQWTSSPNSEVILSLPKTEMQKFVHLCDYIASRKQLEYNFSVE